MADLNDLGALNARYVEFLRGLDDATARAIIDGTMRLAAVPVGATAVAAPTPPATEADRVARDLRQMTPGAQRGRYLTSAGLTVTALRQVAKVLGISGYSRLRKPDLVELLVGYPADDGEGASAPPVPATTVVDGLSNGSAAPVVEVEPVRASASVGAVAHPAAAAIAARLRTTDTVEAGAAYLRDHHLDRAGLLAVAAELQLTRVDRLSRVDLEKRVLKQAITARRKFAGLRKW